MRGKLIAATVLLTLFLGTLPANALGKVRCEVMTIQASNSKKGIDPALSAYKVVFKQRPFSAFDTFQLVHRQTYEMAVGTPTALSMPKTLGGSLSLNGEVNLKLSLTLTLARNGQRPININGTASPGAPFFAAGLKNPSGVWILGIACKHNDFSLH